MKILRKEVVIKGHGGVNDAIDDLFKSLFNITDNEYDYLCEVTTDEELESMTFTNNPTFSQKRRALEVRNKYIKYYGGTGA